MKDPAVQGALEVIHDPNASMAQACLERSRRKWRAQNVLLDAGAPGVWQGGLSAEQAMGGRQRTILPVEWNPHSKRWQAATDFEFNGKIYNKGQGLPDVFGEYAPRRPGLPPGDDGGWLRGQLTDAEFEALRQMAMQRQADWVVVKF